ncbi:site-specific integrase [Candidatus Microgenomates bacterium]|nr:site-specific integrase [Candidatus Microgenomates bacterium]
MKLPNEIIRGFEIKLRTSSLSEKTIRNYLSDVAHFSSWVITLLGTSEFTSHLTPTIIEKYKSSSLEAAVPARTINRRLSAIRLLGKYLQENGFLSQNPAQSVANVEVSDADTHEQLLAEFKKHLEEQKVSQKTIRNYVSDVRNFLDFARN